MAVSALASVGAGAGVATGVLVGAGVVIGVPDGAGAIQAGAGVATGVPDGAGAIQAGAGAIQVTAGAGAIHIMVTAATDTTEAGEDITVQARKPLRITMPGAGLTWAQAEPGQTQGPGPIAEGLISIVDVPVQQEVHTARVQQPDRAVAG